MTKQKTNKDIIVEELENWIKNKAEITIKKTLKNITKWEFNDVDDFATTLLAKLNQGKLIAEGKVKLETRYENQLGEEVTKITVGKENLKMVEILKKLEGKKIKLWIEEE